MFWSARSRFMFFSHDLFTQPCMNLSDPDCDLCKAKYWLSIVIRFAFKDKTTHVHLKETRNIMNTSFSILPNTDRQKHHLTDGKIYFKTYKESHRSPFGINFNQKWGVITIIREQFITTLKGLIQLIIRFVVCVHI